MNHANYDKLYDIAKNECKIFMCTNKKPMFLNLKATTKLHDVRKCYVVTLLNWTHIHLYLSGI